MRESRLVQVQTLVEHVICNRCYVAEPVAKVKGIDGGDPPKGWSGLWAPDERGKAHWHELCPECTTRAVSP